MATLATLESEATQATKTSFPRLDLIRLDGFELGWPELRLLSLSFVVFGQV
jgi:hypothetical protein